VDPQLSPSEADELAGCFRANAKALFGYACVVTRGDQALAHDLVQRTFQEAAVGWSTIRNLDRDELRAWLRTMMHHLAVSEFHHNETVRRTPDHIEHPYRASEQREEREALTAIALERCWRVITEMPERQHLIALMYWRIGMKQSEIAEALRITPDTVTAQLHGAQRKLLAGLKERNPFTQDDIEGLTVPAEEGGATT
jgi:RNA polymerase sigma-70 factor, ECF subfamily